MNTKTHKVEVVTTKVIEIKVAEGAISPEFMEDFRESFYNFKTEEEHIKHIAQAYARDCVSHTGFLEGYGYLKINGTYRYCGPSPDCDVMDIDVREKSEETDTKIL